MLYLVGLGLGDATDISVRGLAIVRRAARVYLEAYTSVLTVGKEALVSPRHVDSSPDQPLLCLQGGDESWSRNDVSSFRRSFMDEK